MEFVSIRLAVVFNVALIAVAYLTVYVIVSYISNSTNLGDYS